MIIEIKDKNKARSERNSQNDLKILKKYKTSKQEKIHIKDNIHVIIFK